MTTNIILTILEVLNIPYHQDGTILIRAHFTDMPNVSLETDEQPLGQKIDQDLCWELHTLLDGHEESGDKALKHLKTIRSMLKVEVVVSGEVVGFILLDVRKFGLYSADLSVLAETYTLNSSKYPGAALKVIYGIEKVRQVYYEPQPVPIEVIDAYADFQKSQELSIPSDTQKTQPLHVNFEDNPQQPNQVEEPTEPQKTDEAPVPKTRIRQTVEYRVARDIELEKASMRQQAKIKLQQEEYRVNSEYKQKMSQLNQHTSKAIDMKMKSLESLELKIHDMLKSVEAKGQQLSQSDEEFKKVKQRLQAEHERKVNNIMDESRRAADLSQASLQAEDQKIINLRQQLRESNQAYNSVKKVIRDKEVEISKLAESRQYPEDQLQSLINQQQSLEQQIEDIKQDTKRVTQELLDGEVKKDILIQDIQVASSDHKPVNAKLDEERQALLNSGAYTDNDKLIRYMTVN